MARQRLSIVRVSAVLVLIAFALHSQQRRSHTRIYNQPAALLVPVSAALLACCILAYSCSSVINNAHDCIETAPVAGGALAEAAFAQLGNKNHVSRCSLTLLCRDLYRDRSRKRESSHTCVQVHAYLQH